LGRIFIQIFDVALESWSGLPQSLCVVAPECGRALEVEHNGDLYSCDHFVYSENRLGNLMERAMGSLITSSQQARFGVSKATTLPSTAGTAMCASPVTVPARVMSGLAYGEAPLDPPRLLSGRKLIGHRESQI
jgi:radical SAM protein with 4Fe4S-binding SPASM domain